MVVGVVVVVDVVAVDGVVVGVCSSNRACRNNIWCSSTCLCINSFLV